MKMQRRGFAGAGLAERVGEPGAVTRPSTLAQYADYLNGDGANVTPRVKSHLLKPE